MDTSAEASMVENVGKEEVETVQEPVVCCVMVEEAPSAVSAISSERGEGAGGRGVEEVIEGGWPEKTMVVGIGCWSWSETDVSILGTGSCVWVTAAGSIGNEIPGSLYITPSSLQCETNQPTKHHGNYRSSS